MNHELKIIMIWSFILGVLVGALIIANIWMWMT